jgi:hypothetical protein
VNSKDYYPCPKCHFRLDVTSLKQSFIRVGARSVDNTKTLALNKIYLGSLQPTHKDCYEVPITIKEDKSTRYVINIYSFLKNVKLSIRDSVTTFKPAEYNITNDLILVRQKNEIQKKVFCFTSLLPDRMTSYHFSISREEDLEKNQLYNFLPSGLSFSGFLPPGNVTTYKHWRSDIHGSDMNIILKVNKGNPELYAYVCRDFKQCQFNQTRVKNELISINIFNI